MGQKRTVKLDDLEDEELPHNEKVDEWPIDSVLKLILLRKKGNNDSYDVTTSNLMSIAIESGFFLKQSSIKPEPSFVYFVEDKKY